LALVFDAAHALGCTAGGRPVGSFGDAEVFSFHATKFVNSFEGGAVVTDDDRLAARVRSMKNFGFAGYDEVTGPGTNGKMAEVCAAMGLTSLEGMAGFIAVNRAHHQAYRERLYDVPGLRLLEYDDAERSNHQYVVVEVDEGRTGLGRDALLGVLHAENVLARRYFHPGCHRMEPYRSLYPDVGGRLPVTERIASRVLTLPTGTGVSGADVATVCDLIRFAVEHGAAVEGRLARARAGVPSEAT
jgi:dTDP-4-amino-4,6-dideoxygalactose transaminase